MNQAGDFVMQRFLKILSVFFLLALAGGPAMAQPTPRGSGPSARGVQAGKVQLDVLVVHATNTHKQIDPKVNKYHRYLKHLAYTGYSPLKSHTLNLAPNKETRFELEGGRKVVVELLHRDERRARIRVQIIAAKGGKLLDTTMSVSRNASVIVAGPKYKEGILVLPLTARY
jgi:hypothetical protein